MSREPEITVKICAGLGGMMSGSQNVISAFEEAIGRKDVDAQVKPKVHKVGCLGLCARDVLVDVYIGEKVYTYQHVTPSIVEEIVDRHFIGGEPVREHLVDEAYQDFHRHQEKILMRTCGRIDPESIDAYLETGGYGSLEKALSMDTGEIVQSVKDSGLRGRGGAGFPTGIKWAACAQSPGPEKYILCNADEGDPGAFMDRAILEGNPHAVIEGMTIGAFATGGTQGYIYVRAEYPLAVQRLQKALDQARERGYLGENILGTGFSFDIDLFLGAGAFVCGEETALMASMEDKPGEPKLKYVFPTEKGLWDKPTVLNNVESWANIPVIVKEGPEWYGSFGTEKSKGTKMFSLAGKINNTGLIEVPFGTPLRRIIYDIGGGIPAGKELKAVQMGGPSGGCIPASHIDTPVDYESIAELGAIIGSGGMIVLDEDSCMVDVALYFVSFCADESCGQCTPCREGVHLMKNILTEITEGRGREEHLDQLEELCDIVEDSSLCGLGKTAPNPVRSTLRYFRDEYLAHIRDEHCPAGVCKRLVPVNCQMACPAGIDVPSYVALIAHGQHQEAVEVIREDNPFPWVCGLVCPAPCQSSCQRGNVDIPICIRALKEYAGRYAMERAGGYVPHIKTRRPEKVAIVGSGPAGLSAAYYLAVEGYGVTVHESLEQAGGMLRVGIPPYRLPKHLLDKEIESFQELGIEIKTESFIGSESDIQDLFHQGHSAVFLSIGAHKPLSLGIQGEDASGVMQGVEYLKRLNLGQSLPRGKNVVVIGGGNVATDVARSALKNGADSVSILYRRTRTEMPAYEEEIEEALEEGVEIVFLRAPAAVSVRDGRVSGLRCVKMKMGAPDASGRRRPIPIEGSEYEMEADLIIPAIGQVPDNGPFEDIQGLEFSGRGTIKVDAQTLATGRDGVYAGGDAVTGPATVVEAIAAGKRAAYFMHAYIQGIPTPRYPSLPVKRRNVARLELSEEQLESLQCPTIPKLPMDRRKSTFEQVELGYTEKMARDEAKRCLRCDLA
jgi:NADH-quinone oxidoreductase subunit F